MHATHTQSGMNTEKLGCFNGIADEPIPEDQSHKRFGWTRTQWLTDPRVPGTLLDSNHDTKPIGKVLYPYIGKAIDDPTKDMLAFRGGVFLDHPKGPEMYSKVQSGEVTGLSIQYTTDIHLVPGNEAITGKSLEFISILNNPRNKGCRITARQGADPSTVTLNIAVTPIPDTTKAPSTGYVRLPLIASSKPSKMSGTTPASTSTPSPTTTPAPEKAQSHQDKPAEKQVAPAPQQQGDQDEYANAQKRVKEVTDMSVADLKKQALLHGETQRKWEEAEKRAQETAAKLATYEAKEQERLKAESDARLKDVTDKYQSALSDLGVNMEGPAEGQDEQLNNTFRFLIQDPEAIKTKASALLTNAVDKYSVEKNKNAELMKQLEESKLVIDAMKRYKPASSQFSSSPVIDSKQAAGGGDSVTRQLQQETKRAQGATMSQGLLHPATITGGGLLRFPTPVSTGTKGTQTFVNIPQKTSTLAATGNNPLARLLTAQSSNGTGPSSGDSIESVYNSLDDRTKKVLNCFTDDPNIIRQPNGQLFDMRRAHEKQQHRVVYESDQQALINTALNSGIGRTMASGNFVEDQKDPANRMSQSVNPTKKRIFVE